MAVLNYAFFGTKPMRHVADLQSARFVVEPEKQGLMRLSSAKRPWRSRRFLRIKKSAETKTSFASRLVLRRAHAPNSKPVPPIGAGSPPPQKRRRVDAARAVSI